MPRATGKNVSLHLQEAKLPRMQPLVCKAFEFGILESGCTLVSPEAGGSGRGTRAAASLRSRPGPPGKASVGSASLHCNKRTCHPQRLFLKPPSPGFL